VNLTTPSVIAELGLRPTVEADVARAWAEVVPEACVPGTAALRPSVLATWADVITGAVAGNAISPRIPLTLDLEIQLTGNACIGDVVEAEAIAVKAGRTVVVCQATFRLKRTHAPIAVALASFIASPDPSHLFPGGFPDISGITGRLSIPLAERIGATVISPGVAEVPRRPDGLNATGAIQGGLIAMAAEEAAMSLAAHPTVPDSLNVRYLRPFSIGPCRAEATGDERSSVVRLVDAGTGKIGAIATVRLGSPEVSDRAKVIAC
jgi:acyl-coenzyme A thioesterase PaaI-like protein